jgi:hypothetical protein
MNRLIYSLAILATITGMAACSTETKPVVENPWSALAK